MSNRIEDLPSVGCPEQVDVLIVGTLGGGGIHQYITELSERLPDRYNPKIFDMHSEPSGSGVLWAIRSVMLSILSLIVYPFQSTPDIVHIHVSQRFSFYRAASYVIFSKYIWNRPVVLHIHGSSFKEFLEVNSVVVRMLQKLIFKVSDQIIVLSDYWKDIVFRQTSTGKLRVIPNAVDPDEYSPDYDNDPMSIVYVSGLVERKGVLKLLAAIEALPDDAPSYQVHIAGKGPLNDVVTSYEKANDNVTYHGYVSEEKKRNLLNNGSVFVLPSNAEGLPIAILEAMAGGNAIVSSAVGSIPEVISDDQGIIVDENSVDQLRDAINCLLMSPEKVKRMAAKNRDIVQNEYSWDGTLEKIELAYCEAMS